MARKCGICGGDIGYLDIHQNLHDLFDKEEIPNVVDAGVRNQMIFKYLDENCWLKNAFLNNIKEDTYEWANEMTPIQRIDREIRNVLQPKKKSKKAVELEADRHDHYALQRES